MPDPSFALRSRVLAAVAQSPSMTRRRARGVATGLNVLSVLLAIAIFELIGGFAHGAGRPLHVTLTLAGGGAVLAAGMTWTVLGRGRHSTLARRPTVVAAVVLAAPVLTFLWMHAFYGSYAEPYQAVGYRCLRYTLLMAALPLGSLLVLRRGIEPRRPAVLGAGMGAVCGAWAGLLVDLWCPLTLPSHVLVGHVLPLVALTVAGAVLGETTLVDGRRWRPARR